MAGGDRGSNAPGALSSPHRRQEAGACVPVRACIRARPCAPPPVRGEVHTAPRAAGCVVGGAVAKARRAERGRILMGTAPTAAPHWLLSPPTPSSGFRLHWGARLGPTRSTQILRPWSPGHYRLICPSLRSNHAQWRRPGPAGLQAASGLCNQETQVHLGNKATTLREGKDRAKERKPQPLQSCLPHATWSKANVVASSASPCLM